MTPSLLVQFFLGQRTRNQHSNYPRSKQMKKIKNFINDESGIETIEYAIIAAIVAAVALLIYGTGWGGSVQNTLKNAAAKSTTATL
jgi:Flp pilus assembly pilin Flp